MPIIPIKALSVNDAWQGRRFKTEEYKTYEIEIMYLLPPLEIPLGKLRLNVEFGIWNQVTDVDNLLKPFIDCLQKKYQFNDRRIYEIHARKIKTKKKNQYIRFQLTKIMVK